MLAFRSFPAPDSGEGFRKHLARFYRFEERMRRFTGGDEGKKGHGFRGDGVFFFLPLFCFWPIRAAPRGFPQATEPLRNKSGAALEGQEEGLSGVGPPPCVFLLLEVVAVADASVQRAGPVTDVRVPVHVDGSLRSYRHAQ
ncbi:hypothetical protein CXT85_06480, partial [Akkermansia muciniphila]